MTPLLMKKFNEETMDKFDYLKLSSVLVYVKTARIEIELLFPEKKQQEVNDNAKLIINSIRKVVDSLAQVEVSFRKSHFDLDFYKKELQAFFEDYPSIKPLIDYNNLTVIENGDVVELDFLLDESAYNYVIHKQIDKKLSTINENSFCEKIIINFKPIDSQVDVNVKPVKTQNDPVFGLERDDGRTIIPENVSEIIGAPIEDRAYYISDCTKPDTEVIICGTISEMQELKKKPKEDGTDGGVFYKFTLSDYTGSIKCLIFPNKRNSDKLCYIKSGMTVVLTGSTKQSTFRGVNTIDVFVKDVSACTLPSEFEENRILMLVPEEYKYVKPIPYFEKTQVGLFGQEKVDVPKILLGREFVLFDLEATGKDPATAKIIEIAGAFVKDGVIVETFTTLVNPKMEIPSEITKLTSISNDDVVDAYTIDQVMPDFFKFVDNRILVGHNVNFYDLPLLNAEGERLKIRFLNSTIDTYQLAKKYLKGLGLKNLKLNTLAEHYGFKNEHAHRAESDIIANYKMFVEMCRDIEKFGGTI